MFFNVTSSELFEFSPPKTAYAWLTQSSRHRLPLLVSWQTATYFFLFQMEMPYRESYFVYSR